MADETSLKELLSVRTRNALARGGIETIEQLNLAYPDRLLKIPGIGLKGFLEIERVFFPGEDFASKGYQRKLARRMGVIYE